ncbi:hypothetical protein B9Z55_024350 [Caenorhabditis nigoni]|uniref:Uncharacterized protein n=1 Tax=Caenorhabditis nigoni TaxID=1611254 RepID=A0A2G5STV6_9PELO|nr:hypothetical protein B9Z55_024350 [Caenorhabditis nigoni]
MYFYKLLFDRKHVCPGFSTSATTGVSDFPDILAQTEHGCSVLIDGNHLREVINSVDTQDQKQDLLSDVIRQLTSIKERLTSDESPVKDELKEDPDDNDTSPVSRPSPFSSFFFIPSFFGRLVMAHLPSDKSTLSKYVLCYVIQAA